MKRRWLIAIASLAMAITFVFGVTACKENPGPNNGTKSDEEIAQTAINTLDSLYLKDGAVKNYETPDNYTVLGQVNVDGTLYPVTWTPTAKTESVNIAECVTIGEKDSKGQVTIGITRKTVDVEYTLTASVTAGQATKTTQYDHKIPKKSSEDATTASLSFATADARVSQTAQQQVWKNNGITFTNDKGTGNDIVDSKNPVKLYAGSIVTIEFNNMIRLDFHCDTPSFENTYPTDLKNSIEAAYPTATVTVDEDTRVVSVVLAGPVNSITFTMKKQVRLDSLDVEGLAGELSDAQKVAAAKASLKLAQTLYFEQNTVTLTTESNGATIAWSIKETTSNASIESGKLKVTTLPTAETKLTLVATITSGEESDTAEFQITLKPQPTLQHAGTQADPYSAADVIAISNLLTSGSYYMKDGANAKIYVKGYIIAGAWSSTYNNFDKMYIADSDTSTTDSADALQIFGLGKDDQFITEENLVMGASITILGGIQNYSGKAEIALQPQTVALEDSRTPAQKVESALNGLKDVTVTQTGDVELTTSSGGVAFTWALKSGENLPAGTTFANNKLTVTKLPATDTTVKFVVTAKLTGATDQTKEISVTIKAESAATEGFTPITAPAAGSDYYLAMDIKGTWYYSTGAMSSHFLGTTTDISKAAKVTVAASGSGWTLFTNGKYLEIEKVDTYNNIALKDSATEGKVWMWDAAHAVFTMTVGTDTFFMGTFGDYTTFNAAYTSYLDSDNEYIGKIGTYTGAIEPGPQPTEGFQHITEPIVGTYVMGMQVEDTIYYLKGGMNGYYLATSSNPADAVEVTLAASGSDYVIKYGTQFIEVEVSGTYINAVYKDAQTAGKVWKWNAEHELFTMEVNGSTYYLGTYWMDGYNYPYNTIGASDFSKYSETKQYHARLGKIGTSGGGGEEPPAEDEILYTLSTTTKTGSNSGYANNCDVELDGVTWNIEGNSTELPWRFGGKSITATDRKLSGKTAIKGTVKQVVITFGPATITVNSITFNVFKSDPTVAGAVATFTTPVAHTAGGTVTIDAPDAGWTDCFYQIVFNVTNSTTSNKYVSVNEIEFRSTAKTDVGGGDEPEENYGTLEKPLTVAEAIALSKTISGNGYLGGSTDPIEVYVKGYVISIDGWDSSHNDWTNVYIADTNDASATQKVQVYRLGLDTVFLKAQADLVEGAQITLFGCLQSYNGNAEVSHNPATNTNCKAVAYERPAHVHKWTYTYNSALKHTKVCNEAGCDLNQEPQTEACTPVANVCECGHTATQEEIITAVKALASGKTLSGTYELTGTVDSRGVVKTGTSGDWQFYIKVGDLTLEVYYASHAIVTATTLYEGDVVTVLGKLKNYSGTKEFDSGAKITKWTPLDDKGKVQKVLDSITSPTLLYTETKSNVSLSTGTNKVGATVTWSVVDTTDVVSIAENKLTVSKIPETETQVKIKVTVTLNEETAEKEFTLTIRKKTDKENADAASQAITSLPKTSFWEVKDNVLELPTENKFGATITWTLGDEANAQYVKIVDNVLSIIKLPEDADVKIYLTLTAKVGQESTPRENYFSITVKMEDKITDLAEKPVKAGEFYLTIFSNGTRYYVKQGASISGTATAFTTVTDKAQAHKFDIYSIYTNKYIIKSSVGTYWGVYAPAGGNCKPTPSTATPVETPAQYAQTGYLWEWDDTHKIFFCTIGEVKYVYGASGTSIGASKYDDAVENESYIYAKLGSYKGETLEAPQQGTSVELYDVNGNKLTEGQTIELPLGTNLKSFGIRFYVKVLPATAQQAVDWKLDAEKQTLALSDSSVTARGTEVYISYPDNVKANQEATLTVTAVDTSFKISIKIKLVDGTLEPFKGQSIDNPLTVEEMIALIDKIGVEDVDIRAGAWQRYYYVKGKIMMTEGRDFYLTSEDGTKKLLLRDSTMQTKYLEEAQGLTRTDIVEGSEVIVSSAWRKTQTEDGSYSYQCANVNFVQLPVTTDDQMLRNVKGRLAVDFTSLEGIEAVGKEIDLAALAAAAGATKYNVKVTWALTSPADAATYLELKDNKLKVIKLPDTAITFKLTATISKDGVETPLTKDFTFNKMATTADVKIAEVAQKLTISFEGFDAVNDTIDLKAAVDAAVGDTGAAVKWTLYSPASSYMKISTDGSTLTLNKLPTEAVACVINAQISLANGTSVTVTFRFTLNPAAQAG